jgi:hypothetical protein
MIGCPLPGLNDLHAIRIDQIRECDAFRARAPQRDVLLRRQICYSPAPAAYELLLGDCELPRQRGCRVRLLANDCISGGQRCFKP